MEAPIFKFTSAFPSFLPGPSHAVACAGLGDRPRLETVTVGAEAGRGRRSRVRGSAARPRPGPSRVIMSHHDRRVWGRGPAIGIQPLAPLAAATWRRLAAALARRRRVQVLRTAGSRRAAEAEAEVAAEAQRSYAI
jgi:hypothetical protein